MSMGIMIILTVSMEASGDMVPLERYMTQMHSIMFTTVDITAYRLTCFIWKSVLDNLLYNDES